MEAFKLSPNLRQASLFVIHHVSIINVLFSFDFYAYFLWLYFQSFEALQLSPGVNTVRYAHKKLLERKLREERRNLPAVKQRRYQLKIERLSTERSQEVLEGDTYQSGIIATSF